MPTQKQILYGALIAAVALYLYSKSKKGAAAIDSGTAGALDFIDVTASRIASLVTSRGYRNNNPGNIRYIAVNPWNGQIGNDAGYGIYDTPQNGVRALGHQLFAYHASRGLDTVRGIINVWAPPSENQTSAYVTDVASQMNVGTDEPFDVNVRLQDLATAITKHENGYLDSNFDMSWVYL